MRTDWEPDELIGAWTLVESDWKLIANKTGVTRLGFVVMLKFYEIEGRFPAYPEEVPRAAVDYMASLVRVDPALFAKYSWRGRTIEYHRAQIRKAYGTRPPTETDEDRWARWLAGEMCPAETNRDRLAAAVRRRCPSEKVEPPASGQVERVVASGCRRFDEAFAATVAGRLGPPVRGRLEDLLSRPDVLAELKSDPGPLGLDTLLIEIGKLTTVRALGLTEAVFTDTSDRIVAAWRARAARMYPSDFADCPDPAVRHTLLAALCWTRQAELVDSLVELLIGLIHRINARAERRVEKELIGALTNVPGKRTIFTKMVDAALERPDDTVREALYPVVPGGVMTLEALAKELKATERALAERVRYQLRGSYSHYTAGECRAAPVLREVHRERGMRVCFFMEESEAGQQRLDRYKQRRDEYIRKLAHLAPPLSEERKARLAVLLAPAVEEAQEDALTSGRQDVAQVDVRNGITCAYGADLRDRLRVRKDPYGRWR